MRLIVRRAPLRRLVKWTQRLLLAGGIVLLGVCAFAMVDTWIFQRRESADLDRLLRARGAAAGIGPPAAPAASGKRVLPASADGLIGRMEIPRLQLSVMVVEGVGRTTLRRAAGHIPGTALPGEPGNVGVAGHRDTLFRPLKDLKIGDEIQFSTLRGDFTYIVESLRIVEPDDLRVLASSDENVLTLVTCYPFFYVGAAPRRFIVRARQAAAQTALSANVE